MAWSEQEKQAIRFLRDQFRSGKLSTGPHTLVTHLDISETEIEGLLRRLIDSGLVEYHSNGEFVRAIDWEIKGRIVDEAERLDQKADRIIEAQNWFRSHPVASLFLLGFVIVAALVKFANEALTLIDRLALWKR